MRCGYCVGDYNTTYAIDHLVATKEEYNMAVLIHVLGFLSSKVITII